MPSFKNANPPMDRATFRANLAAIPRVKIAHLPTPLEELHRLSAELGGPRILIKRDDATGLAMGGNKARHYEFELAHLVEQSYDAYVNMMDYHSNNARMTAAASNKFGIKYSCVLRYAAGREIQGNLLIDKILGADLHLLDEEQSELSKAEEYARELGRKLEAEGYKPYVRVDHEFPTIVGTLGYLNGALELLGQLEELGIHTVKIIGVGGRSTGGLTLAAKNLGLDWDITGVMVNYDMPIDSYLYEVIPGAARVAKLAVGFEPGDMNILDQYIGEGYGLPTQEALDGIHLMAKAEAILTDPNYTGTVMAALIDQVKQGNFTKDDTVVILHTGGLPALFTFADELWKHEYTGV
jgi:1-aminocyclopropane-1-carboxylate deaminase/D-cysteine desulfhydrase-like pyridoxal-dependent ACC family enzyme